MKVEVNTNKLKGKIAECGLTNETFAKAIGIDNSTFFRKMKSKGLAFSIGQMHRMADILSLSPQEASDIFLSQNSH